MWFCCLTEKHQYLSASAQRSLSSIKMTFSYMNDTWLMITKFHLHVCRAVTILHAYRVGTNATQYSWQYYACYIIFLCTYTCIYFCVVNMYVGIQWLHAALLFNFTINPFSWYTYIATEAALYSSKWRVSLYSYVQMHCINLWILPACRAVKMQVIYFQ